MRSGRERLPHTVKDGTVRPPKPATSVPLLYTMAEGQSMLRVGRTTIKQLVYSGELRSVRIGRARRIPADALVEYVTRLEAEQRA